MSAPPPIGALRHRVTLEGPVDLYDGLGGFTRDFAPLAQIWARVETQSVNEDFVEQRREQLRRSAVTIRWRSDVMSQMRFDFRGRKLLIKGVVDGDERRRFLICQCEEIA
ncbi:MAG: phage head closure protein [Methylocystis sp.]|uniref:phage head closure protein n=1 Tax=Methylocystis sp. TaxID=1911079 RepID=UPI003DA58A9B